MTILNKVADRGSPCLTPEIILNSFASWLPSFTFAVELIKVSPISFISFLVLHIWLGIQWVCSCLHSQMLESNLQIYCVTLCFIHNTSQKFVLPRRCYQWWICLVGIPFESLPVYFLLFRIVVCLVGLHISCKLRLVALLVCSYYSPTCRLFYKWGRWFLHSFELGVFLCSRCCRLVYVFSTSGFFHHI